MGLFGYEVENSFDEMFDLNRDGFLDAGEQVLQMDYIMESVEGNGDSYEDGYGDGFGDGFGDGGDGGW